MKKTSRITAFLLTLLILLASCSEKSTDKEKITTQENETTVSETTEAAETESEIETASKKIEKKFADKSYGGKTFTMLGYDVGQHYYNNISPIFNEIWADGYTGEIINDAVFDRNSKTEVLLDIKLEHLFNSNIPNMIKQAVSSSSNDFTAALGSLSGLGSSFEAGELANLMNFENIDTTAEWYDKNCVDTFTLFGDRLYWLTGDYMLCDDYAVHVFFYNKNIIENNGFDQPYAMVEEGKWTMDYFDTLVNACVRDVDGNGTIDINSDKDIVGLIGNADEPKHWIYGAREKSIEIDDEGSFVVNTLSERHINVAEKIYRILVEDKVFYIRQIPYSIKRSLPAEQWLTIFLLHLSISSAICRTNSVFFLIRNMRSRRKTTVTIYQTLSAPQSSAQRLWKTAILQVRALKLSRHTLPKP